jgi:hypothetical protein
VIAVLPSPPAPSQRPGALAEGSFWRRTAALGTCIGALFLFGETVVAWGADQAMAPPHRRAHEGPAPVAVYPRLPNEDPNKDPKRHAIGRHFRFPGRDMTDLPPGVEPAGVFTHELVGLPALPAGPSDMIVVGRVTAAHAYLTPDLASVYSEFTVRVERSLKNAEAAADAPSRVLAYRNGGAVRFPSGRIHQYRAIGVGLPEAGSRYVLFLKRIDGTGPLRILTAYRLTRQGVMPLDDPPPFAAYAGVSEETLLGEITTALASANVEMPSR